MSVHRHGPECWERYEPCGEHHRHDYNCGGGRLSRACPSYWFKELPEYRVIHAFYRGRSAKRSGVPYLNHITEGLKVLEWIGASQEAERAYCLHPLVQKDEDLKDRTPRFGSPYPFKNLTRSVQVMALAMEYRSVANDFLSPDIDTLMSAGLTDLRLVAESAIRLSPLQDVNDMLIADKVQNYKDFLIYHADTHPRADALHLYFKAWLIRLGVSLETFQEYKERLTA